MLPNEACEFSGTLKKACLNYIVCNSHLTLIAVKYLPFPLIRELTECALNQETVRDRALVHLVQFWPRRYFELRSVIPSGYTNPSDIIINSEDRFLFNDKLRRDTNARRWTTAIIFSLIECIQRRRYHMVRSLDLTGYLTDATNLVHLYNKCDQYMFRSITDRYTLTVNLHPAYKTTDEVMAWKRLLKDGGLVGCDWLDLRVKSMSLMLMSVREGLLNTFKFLRLQSQHITSLCLEYCTNDDIIEDTCELTRHLIHLTALNITHENLSASSKFRLHEILQNLPSLRKLHLGYIHFETHLPFILSSPRLPLKHLALDKCWLRDSDISFLSTNEQLASLNYLSLSNNNTSSWLIHPLITWLTKLQTSLKILKLENCRLSREFLLLICNTLVRFESLYWVDLIMNNVAQDIKADIMVKLNFIEYIDI